MDVNTPLVQTPCEQERILKLAGGAFTDSLTDSLTDATGDSVSARREAGTRLVTIGAERYEIPDAALAGG